MKNTLQRPVVANIDSDPSNDGKVLQDIEVELTHLEQGMKWSSEETTIEVGGGVFVVTGVVGSFVWASQKGFDFWSVASATMAVGVASGSLPV